jgi:hypothetical protein
VSEINKEFSCAASNALVGGARLRDSFVRALVGQAPPLGTDRVGTSAAASNSSGSPGEVTTEVDASSGGAMDTTAAE